MAEREYIVSIRADASDLKAKFREATAAGTSFVGELKAELMGGFKEGFEKGVTESIKKGTETIKNFGEESKKTATSSLSSFESIALKITGIVGALDLAGKAMSAIGSSIGGVFAGLNRGADLDDLSQQLGVAVEQLSSFELSAKLGGLSLETMGRGIEGLTRRMTSAIGGSKETQAAFAAVGISAAELGKLDTDEVLGRIADAFAGAEDGAAKTGLAMELLGRTGSQLIPVLNKGSEGLRQNAELSRELGAVMTTEVAQSMGQVMDAFDVFGTAVTGVQNQLAVGMAPALARTSERFIEMLGNLGIADGRLQQLGASIGTFVGDALEQAIGIIERFNERVSQVGFGEAIGQALNEAGALIAAKASEIGGTIGTNMGSAAAEAFKAAFVIDWRSLVQSRLGSTDEILREIEAGLAARSQGSSPGAAINAAAGIASFDAAVESAKAKAQPFLKLTDDLGSAFQTLGTRVPPAASAIDKAGDAAQKTGLALPVVSKGADEAAKAAEKAANAAEQLAAAFGQAVTALLGGIEATEGQNAALERIIDGNLSATEAQVLLNDALQQAAVASALARDADIGRAEVIGELARKLAEEQQAQAALNAVRNAQVQTGTLQLELSLTQQVNAGLISQLEKEVALARARAAGNEQLADQYEQQVLIKDAIADQEASVIHLGDVFRDSFDQAFDAVIDGTRDMGDVLEGIGIGIGKRFFSAMLDSKLKDFDPTVKANFLDLGEFGKSVFGDLFSGGGGSGSSGSFLGQAKDWLGNLFGGGSSAGGALDIIGQNADGSFIFSDGSEGFGQSIPSTGSSGGGFSFGGAVAGAGAGYASSSYFGKQWITDTGLSPFLSQVQDEAISNLRGINQVIATVLGAVFGGLAGGGGAGGGIIGAVVGAFTSLVGDTWGDRIDRDVLRNRGFGPWGGAGPAAGASGWSFDLVGSTDPLANFVMTQLLGLPTLGTAYRRAGEGAIDASRTFGGEDGKGGLQALLGDFTRSGASNQRGPEIAIERGLTQAQVDAIMGGTGSIFSQLAGDEKFPEDTGRFAEAMGRTMAEFLSRGLAEGMDYDDMLASLASFAAESGATIQSSVENLNAQLEQSKAAGIEFGKLDPTAAATQGAEAYAASLYGISEVFSSTLPAGVNIAQLALQTMEKDGVKAFENIDHEGRETLTNLTKDAELFQDVVTHLVEQGFTIDTEEFETRLEAITASAQFLGESFGTFFQFENVGVGVEAVFQSLKSTILGTFQEVSAKQLFEGTDFAASFEPVFAAMARIEEFDLTTATGSQGFMDLLLPALAQGKANLQEYIPILQLMADNWKEIEKIIDEAMEPDDAERAAIAVEQVFSGLGGILDASLSEGIAVLANGGTYQEALNVFKGTFATGVETALKQAAFNAMVDSVVLQPLIQKWQPALSYVMAAGMANGFDDPKVREAWRIVLQGLGADAEALAPLIFDARIELEDGDAVMRGFFNSLQASIDSIGQSLSGGISSLIRESIDIGIEDGLRAGQKHFAENIGQVMYDVLLDAIVRAFVDSVLVEGILGPVIAEGAALYAAASDPNGPGGRFITPEEQAGLNEWRDYFGEVFAIAREQADEFGRWLIEEAVTPPGEGNPHDGYYTTRRPIGDVDPISFDGRGRSLPVDGYDPETEGRRLVEETVKPPVEALADLIDTRVIPGLADFTDAVREAAGALSSLDGGGDGGDTTTGGSGRRFPGGRGLDGAAAMGGTFGPGSTFLVGEQGPEVVVYGEDGSMEVIPIDHATMQSLLDGGVPGYARGTDRPGIGDFRNGRGPTRPPGGGGGSGPGLGAPITSPLDPRHPDYVDPRDKEAAGESELDVLVSFNFDNAIEEFARGGSAEDLKEALKMASGEGILEGMMNALVESLAFEEFNQKLSDATREAMKDGVIDAAEAAELGKMAEEFAAGAEASILAMGPAFDAVATAFGLKTEEEVIDALATATATAGDLIGSSLRSALRDPANLSFETFSLALRQAVYGNIVDGLVDAFIDAAVIQGALAPMLAVITEEFGNLGLAIAAGSAEGIAAASAAIATQVGLIAGVLDDPVFKAAIQSIIDIGTSAASALGLSLETTTGAINTAADGFTSAADAAANACTGECDLEQKLVTTDEKITALDAYGRTGGISDSYYEDVLRDPTGGGADDAEPRSYGPGPYGNPSWRKDRDWRRQRARDRRRDREEDDWFYDPDIPWEEPPHMASGGIVTRPTYALIGEAGPEAVVPLSRGGEESALVREIRELRAELRAHGVRTVDAIQSDRHTEVKMNENTLIDAWTQTKRVADKAGIPFGGDR